MTIFFFFFSFFFQRESLRCMSTVAKFPQAQAQWGCVCERVCDMLLDETALQSHAISLVN